MMKTFIITVNHGVVAAKENEREFFITAETEKDAYQAAKSNLQFFGNDGWEYIVEITEC